MTKRKAVIKNGVVTNIVIADDNFHISGCDLLDVEGLSVKIGDIWDGEKFISSIQKYPPTLTELHAQQLAQAEAIAAIFEMLTGGEA